MSNNIDKNVVSMEFDNRNFEKNVDQSIKSLDNLKKKMNFENDSDGMNSIVIALETVKEKFTALEIVGITALQNITNSAISAGKNLVSSLSTEQISKGWDKYAEKTSAVQTIMAATSKDFEDTGEQMEYVNEQLEKLNWFTDETSYSFLDMVNNIGKFTSNNIPLDKSVTAMQGISTWAAISGANVQEASRAMYNLSQAMAVGSVKLMDWKSIENANMATAEFKEMVIETAVAEGTLKKSSDKLFKTLSGDDVSVSNFNQELSSGWFTSDVLMKTLDKYGDFANKLNEVYNETGLLTSEILDYTEEYINGTIDLEEAAEGTGLTAEELGKKLKVLASDEYELGRRAFKAAQEAKTFREAIDAVKDAVSTSWMKTFELIFGDYEKAKKVWSSFSEWLYEVFAAGGEIRNKILKSALGKSFTSLTKKITAIKEPVDKVVETTSNLKKSLNDLNNAAEEVLKGSFGSGESRFKALTEAGYNYYEVQNKINEKLGYSFRYTEEQIKQQDKLIASNKNLSSTSEEVTENQNDFLISLYSMSYAQLKQKGYTEEQIKSINEFKKEVDKTGLSVEEFVNNMDEINGRWLLLNSFSMIGESILDTINAIKDAWNETFYGTTNEKEIMNKRAEQIYNFIAAFHKLVSSLKSNEEKLNNIKTAFKGLFSVLDVLVKVISIPVKLAFKIFNGILETFDTSVTGILSKIGEFGIRFKKSFDKFVDVNKIVDILTFNLVPVLHDLIGLFLNVGKNIFYFGSSVFKILFSIADALSPLFSKIFNGIAGLISFFYELSKGKEEGKDFKSTLESITNALTNFFSKFKNQTALGKFVTVFEKFWNVIKKIASSIIGVFSDIFDSVTPITKSILESFNVDSIFSMIKNISIIGLIALIKRVITGIKDMLKITEESFGEKLEKILKKAKGILSSVKDTIKAFTTDIRVNSLLKIAIALGILAISLTVLSGIDKEKMKNALSGLTILFSELIGSLTIINKLKINGNINKIAGSLVLIAFAIKILASSVIKLSSLSFEELFKGLVGVGVLLGFVIGTMKALSTESKKAIKGASAIIAISLALKILASVCKTFAAMSWEEIGKGLAGVTALLLEMTAMMMAGKIGKIGLKTAISIVVISLALKILASVCKTFAAMEWEGIFKGITAIGALLGIFGLFSILTKNSKKILSTSVLLIVLCLSLKSLTKTFKELASLSWDGIAKAMIALTGILFDIILFTKLIKKDDIIDMSIGLGSAAAGINVLASAMIKIADLSWESLVKGLLGLTGALLIMVLAAKKMSFKGNIVAAVTITILANAFLILAAALSVFNVIGIVGLMTGLIGLAGIFATVGLSIKLIKPLIPSMVKFALGLMALGGSMVILSIGLAAIGTSLSVFMGSLIGSFIAMKAVKFEDIFKTFIALALGLTIFAAAAKIIKPIIPSILALSGSVALLGFSLLAASVAISIIVAAINALGNMKTETITTAFSNILNILNQVLDYAPVFMSKIFNIAKSFLLDLLSFIVDSAPAIVKALFAIVSEVLHTLVEYIPDIVNTIFDFIIEMIKMLNSQLPKIINLLFDFIIQILNGITERLPELVDSVVKLVVTFFSSVMESFNNIDPSLINNALEAAGILTTLMLEFSAVGALAPLAIVGLGAAAAVASELAFVLAGIGGLSKIPGLEWLVEEGGNFLKKIGSAVGGFIGGIAGSFAESMTASLPNIGTSLGEFMKNAEPFIDGAKRLDNSTMEGVKSLAEVIAILTASNLLDGIASWLTGSSSLTKFGEELASFGPHIKEYADSIVGIDNDAIVASSTAAKALTELASTVPNSGGLAAWLMGDNSIAQFGTELILLGVGLKSFSDSVQGLDSEAITAAVSSATEISKMTETIPNSGGVVAWFAGDNSIAQFSSEIGLLGQGLKDFSDFTKGIKTDNVKKTVSVAKSLAEMTSKIPDSGGVVSWFAGDNSIAKFGSELKDLGIGLKSFSDEIKGIDSEAIRVASVAGGYLTDLANKVPNSGGVVSWFAGDNSIAKFGSELKDLGKGLKDFSIEIEGIKPDDLSSVVKSAESLAEMTNKIPNSGGVESWFAGDNSIAKFGSELKDLGIGLKDFSKETEGIKPDNITSAATAAESLATLSSHVPVSGGFASWFAGETSIAKFGSELKDLGKGLKDFSTETEGISSTTVEGAVAAATAVAAMTETVPKEGGVTSWFTGKSNITKYGSELKDLGKGLKGFSDETKGLNKDDVTAAADAGQAIAAMTQSIPSEGGIEKLFIGSKSLSNYSKELGNLGTGIFKFSNAVKGIDKTSATAGAEVAKTIAEMTNVIPDSGGLVALFAGDNSLAGFSSELEKLGIGIKAFSDATEGINDTKSTAAAGVAKTIAEMAAIIPDSGGLVSLFAGDNSLAGFSSELGKLGTGIKAFSEEVSDIKSYSKTDVDNVIEHVGGITKNLPDDMNKLGNFGNDIEYFANRLIGYFERIKTIATSDVELSDTIVGSFITFYDSIDEIKMENSTKIAKDFVDTFGKIKDISYDTGSGLIKAVEDIGKLNIKSFNDSLNSMKDSTYNIAKDIVDKFVDGIKSKKDFINETGKFILTELSDGMYKGEEKLKSTLQKLIDIAAGDIDTTITLRPVIDMSSVTSSLNGISSDFASGKMIFNPGTYNDVSTSFNYRGSSYDPITSEIKGLRRDITALPTNTYTINGLTYDDGTATANAVNDLTRAINMERRS